MTGAAGNFLANAHELSVKGFKTVLDIDTVGVFNMSTAAYPALTAAAAGSSAPTSVIVNISMTLHYGASHFQVHSSAAKAAIDSLTRSFALEWGPKHIRVVGLAPGPIADTPGMAKLRYTLSLHLRSQRTIVNGLQASKSSTYAQAHFKKLPEMFMDMKSLVRECKRAPSC
jgi:NAD(P)-dependent dehydrogenase (short-subunit alcohol dehydrogenase family)